MEYDMSAVPLWGCSVTVNNNNNNNAENLYSAITPRHQTPGYTSNLTGNSCDNETCTRFHDQTNMSYKPKVFSPIVIYQTLRKQQNQIPEIPQLPRLNNYPEPAFDNRFPSAQTDSQLKNITQEEIYKSAREKCKMPTFPEKCVDSSCDISGKSELYSYQGVFKWTDYTTHERNIQEYHLNQTEKHSHLYQNWCYESAFHIPARKTGFVKHEQILNDHEDGGFLQNVYNINSQNILSNKYPPEPQLLSFRNSDVLPVRYMLSSPMSSSPHYPVPNLDSNNNIFSKIKTTSKVSKNSKKQSSFSYHQPPLNVHNEEPQESSKYTASHHQGNESKNTTLSKSGNRPYKCYCGRTFARNEELTRHQRIHSGYKPHRCHICHKTFGRKDHLNKHVKTHLHSSQKKIYLCEVSNCGQSYTRSDALARHQMNSHGIKVKPSKWRPLSQEHSNTKPVKPC